MGATGIITILVLTGETKEGDISSAKQQPDYVVKDISELREIYSTELIEKKRGKPTNW